MKIVFFLALISSLSYATTLQESDFFDYKVYFTNPTCKTYHYDQPVFNRLGETILSKPQNAYCKAHDSEKNMQRKSSPHYQLVRLIENPEVKELFFTFLSFSNADIANKICDAIERNVKVKFIIDSNNKQRESASRYLSQISNCRPKKSGQNINIPEVYYAGNVKGLGFAHNKLILVKYEKSQKVSIVFGSANMTAGTNLHHENWHFINTSENTFFYKAHVCLKNAMTSHTTSRSDFVKFYQSCKRDIGLPEEDDISLFVVPGEGKQAMNKIKQSFMKANAIDIAVHRFTHKDFISYIEQASLEQKKVRFVADDDIYWLGQINKKVGSNMFMEYHNVLRIIRAGVKVHYVESNQNSKLLHHNKYVIFKNIEGNDHVFAGAGNFTLAAFTKNLENFYFINIPQVAEAFSRQYEYKFNKIATSFEKMPIQYVMP